MKSLKALAYLGYLKKLLLVEEFATNYVEGHSASLNHHLLASYYQEVNLLYSR